MLRIPTARYAALSDLVVALQTHEPYLVQRRRGQRTRLCQEPVSHQAQFALRCNLQRYLFSPKHAEYVKNARLPRMASPATVTCLHAVLSGLQGLHTLYVVAKSAERNGSKDVADRVVCCKEAFIDRVMRTTPLAHVLGVVLAAGPRGYGSSDGLLSTIDREGQQGRLERVDMVRRFRRRLGCSSFVRPPSVSLDAVHEGAVLPYRYGAQAWLRCYRAFYTCLGESTMETAYGNQDCAKRLAIPPLAVVSCPLQIVVK